MIAYGWAAGITLWMIAGFSLAIIHGRITQARDTQIPIDSDTGGTMYAYDCEDFESDVDCVLGDGLYSDSAGGSSDPGGLFVAIGETFNGALFGYEENNYGQRAYHIFATEVGQREWFDAVASAINETEQDW